MGTNYPKVGESVCFEFGGGGELCSAESVCWVYGQYPLLSPITNWFDKRGIDDLDISYDMETDIKIMDDA